MNRKLKKLYENKLEKISFQNEDIFSYPFLIKVPNKYSVAQHKIMIIGQETHGWMGKLNSFNLSDIDRVMNRYEKIFENRVLSRKKSKGKSCFIHRLVKINKSFQNLKDTEMIWNNLLKFDCRGKSSNKYADIVDFSIDVLREELKILEPDILLCQTGPGYDFILKKLFPERKNDKKIFKPRKLWKFTVENKIIYRINHPCSRSKGGIKQFYKKSMEDINITLAN